MVCKRCLAPPSTYMYKGLTAQDAESAKNFVQIHNLSFLEFSIKNK